MFADLGATIIDTDIIARELVQLVAKLGDKYQVDMTQNMKQVLTVGEQTIEIPNEMVMTMSWVIDDVADDGTVKMTQTIDRIRMSMKAPGVGDIKFDSDSKEDPEGVAKMIADMIKPMVGAKEWDG